MATIARPLPEYCYSRRPLREIGGVVVHFFSAINVAPAKWDDPDTCYDLFLDLNAPGPERGLVMPRTDGRRFYASAHYLIDRAGREYQLVPLEHQAYHAGKSRWAGRDNLNAWTVGIELIGAHPDDIARAGMDPDLEHFTDAQYARLTHRVAQLKASHRFPLENVVGHDQVAPGRKRDPGPLFDWERLREPLRSIAA